MIQPNHLSWLDGTEKKALDQFIILRSSSRRSNPSKADVDYFFQSLTVLDVHVYLLIISLLVEMYIYVHVHCNVPSSISRW